VIAKFAKNSLSISSQENSVDFFAKMSTPNKPTPPKPTPQKSTPQKLTPVKEVKFDDFSLIPPFSGTTR
jgi:hypothetical protein